MDGLPPTVKESWLGGQVPGKEGIAIKGNLLEVTIIRVHTDELYSGIQGCIGFGV